MKKREADVAGFITGLAIGVGLAEIACQFLADFSLIRAIWKALR